MEVGCNKIHGKSSNTSTPYPLKYYLIITVRIYNTHYDNLIYKDRK